jgi:hypothetical protein
LLGRGTLSLHFSVPHFSVSKLRSGIVKLGTLLYRRGSIMAKKKIVRKKSAPAKVTAKKAPAKSAKKGTIKPPPAPAIVHSAEVGAPLAQDQAILEKLRLYPNATVQEIIAMFELDGMKVTPAAVQKVKRRLR